MNSSVLEAPTEDTREHECPPTLTSKPCSILVVEDEVSVRKLIESVLKREGHRVIGSAARDEVIALLQSNDFDLVVTDLLMPELEGTEVIRAVQVHQPGAAILAMSGGGNHMTPERCLQLASAMGAHLPLMKPFRIPELLRAVTQAMAYARA